MARTRYLKPDFFIDPDLGELSYVHRLVFAGLWCYADKAGRLEYEPKKLKIQIMPYDKIDMVGILADLTLKPFLFIYEIENKYYIQIINWEIHQMPHHTEKNSVFPAYNGDLTVKQPLDNGYIKEVGKMHTPHYSSRLIQQNSKYTNSIKGEDKFAPPTLEELEKYCKEANLAVNASKMHDFYVSKGWLVGKVRMRDWKAAARNWARSEFNVGSKITTNDGLPDAWKTKK